MAAAFCSRGGQEVAVVYYREGYVPSNYDQQVSTHCLLLEAVAGVWNTPWSCPGWVSPARVVLGCCLSPLLVWCSCSKESGWLLSATTVPVGSSCLQH